jgi:hypothetical protein
MPRNAIRISKQSKSTPRSLLSFQNTICQYQVKIDPKMQRDFIVMCRCHFWLARLLATLPETLLSRSICILSGGMHTRQRTVIGFLTASLPACLDIPSTRTAATQSHLDQPREDGKRACDPHEDKDRDANFGANVEFHHASNRVAEDDEHDGCDDECVEESEDGDRKGEPVREDGDGHEEDEDECEACTREEEAEHPSRDVLDQVEDVVDVGGEINYSDVLEWSEDECKY